MGGRKWPKFDLGQWAAHLFLAGMAFVMLFPFYWMVLTAVRPQQELFAKSFSWWPQTFTGLTHFATALDQAPVLVFMLNGVIVVFGILAVQIVTAIPCGYALAKYDFRGRELLFALIMFVLTVPIQVPALPIYVALVYLGLLDSYFAVMLPFFLSAFAIFLFRQTFKSYPEEIIQAGRLDGMSEWEILWRVVVPSAKPAIAAFAVFSVTAHWNDLYWPLIVIHSNHLATPPLGMMYFADNETGANFGALMATATLLTAPLLVAFVFAQRHFISGITMTGIK